MSGVWLAYYPDLSGVAVFDEEIDALRYAVEKGMDVMFCDFGKDLGEQIQKARGL